MSDKIQPFDPSRRKPAGHTIDMDAPFFEKRPELLRDYSKCDHSQLGFQYDQKLRKVYCRCGEEVEAFDAIVAIAHVGLRQKWAAETIKAEQQRKADEKAKRPFVKKVVGFSHGYDRKQRPISRTYRLECGHLVTQHRGRGFKRHWRSATCTQCFRAAELAKKNVPTIDKSAAGGDR